jgi:lambda family phage portal protein
MPEIKPEIKKSKSGRGGRREGAGRKPAIKALNFEGAAPATAGRGLLVINTVDPKRELTNATRMWLLRKGRWVFNNVPQATYIVEHIAQRAVGTGIVVQPRTKNSQWNREAERAFEDRSCGEAWAFDASGAVNFYTAQSLILRQVAIDGDFFAQFIKTADGAARVRFIGAESIGNVSDEKNVIDGVTQDSFGGPLSYRVLTNRDEGKYEDVTATDILHFRHIRRHGFTRGVSWFHNVILNTQDLAEILAFTKGAFKAASQIGLIITSNEQVRLGGGLSTVNGTPDPATGTSTPVTLETVYNGTLTPKLKPGESVTTLKNDLPGTSFEPFIKHLVGDIALGMGLPPEALMIATGAAGTEFRGFLEVAQNYLERLQQMLIDQFCRRYWKYWVWQEIKSGRLSYPGDDWWRHEWVTPRKITVDNGRDGRLYAELLDKGYMSWERYCNILGLDAESEEDDILATYLRRREKCKAAGVDVSQVFPSNAVPELPPPSA